MTANVINYPVSMPPRELFTDAPELMRSNVGAKLMGVSGKTMIRHIQSGLIPGFKMGRFYFVTRQSLIEFINGGGSIESE